MGAKHTQDGMNHTAEKLLNILSSTYKPLTSSQILDAYYNYFNGQDMNTYEMASRLRILRGIKAIKTVGVLNITHSQLWAINDEEE